MLIKADVRLVNQKSLIAEATVTIRTELGDLNIKRVLIVKGKDDQPFVTLPQASYKAKNGETKYQKLVYGSKDFKDKIDEAVFMAWNEAVKKDPVTA